MKKQPTLFWAVLALFVCYFAYILYRACAIPVTHDESATAILCLRNRTGQLINYSYVSGYISGNNHILNSLSIRFFTRHLHGFSALNIRMGNLIAGAFYLWVGLMFVFRYFQSNWTRTLACMVWVANPYAMEFFGLARGYGMSMALEALAIVSVARYYDTDSRKTGLRWLAIATLCAILAVWANFATLNFYLYFLPALLALMWYKHRKINLEWLVPLAGTAVLYAICATPIAKIKKAGDFKFFGNASFWKDTVESFAECALMGKPYLGASTNLIAGILLAALVLLASAAAVNYWFKHQKSKEAVLWVWLVLLLPGTILVNILIATFNHTSWLNTRTTLFYFPLLVFCLSGLIKSTLNGKHPAQKALIVLMIALAGLHFLNVANLVQAHEWRYDRDTFKALNYIEDCYWKEGRQEPYKLRVHCFQYPSFQFHTWVSKSRYHRYIQEEVQEVPYQFPDVINTEADFYYITKAHFPAFAPNYKVLIELLDGEMLLIRKK